MCLSVSFYAHCLSACVSVCFLICLTVYLHVWSDCMFFPNTCLHVCSLCPMSVLIFIPVRVSVYIFLFVWQSACLSSVCLFICLSLLFYLSICLSAYLSSVCLSIYLSFLSLPVYLHIFLACHFSICLTICLSFLCLSVCLSSVCLMFLGKWGDKLRGFGWMKKPSLWRGCWANIQNFSTFCRGRWNIAHGIFATHVQRCKIPT